MGQQWNAEEHDGLTPRERASLPESLTRALGFLNRRLDEPVVLDDLAAAAGVRPRTLEAHFRAYLGTTPLGWVRRARLARARQQLLAGGSDANVTAIANANGFSELGRFAAHYRRQFGESCCRASIIRSRPSPISRRPQAAIARCRCRGALPFDLTRAQP